MSHEQKSLIIFSNRHTDNKLYGANERETVIQYHINSLFFVCAILPMIFDSKVDSE